MDHIRGINLNQIRMLSLEQMVEPLSPVLIINAFKICWTWKNLISIIGFETLMSKMKAYLQYVFQEIHLLWTKMASFYEPRDIFNPKPSKITYSSELLIY